MNIVEFPLPNLNDIPALLRRLADDIENGSHDTPLSLAAVMETDTGINLFGFGAADSMKSIGLFSIGQAILTAGYVEVDE